MPDKKSDESGRMLASSAFVGVLIIIGVPLWWKTTEVYRVALPYSDINAFKPLSHYIASELVILGNEDATSTELAAAVHKAFEDIDVIKLKISKSVLPPTLQQTLSSVTEESEGVEELAAVHDIATPNKFYLVQRKPLVTDIWLGSERVMFFRNKDAIPTVTEALKLWVYQSAVLGGARADAADDARRARFTASDSYSILLSVVHPNPQDMEVRFNARESMEDYIGTFVDALSVLHNFTLKSQWLHFLHFDFQAEKIADKSPYGRHYRVDAARLQQLSTTLEERSASRVSREPTVSLVLFSVPCAIAPLIVYEDNKRNPSPIQAFSSPRWGGVILQSPTAEECLSSRPVHTPDVARVMPAFVDILRRHLAIHDVPPIPKAHMEPLRSVTPRRWEVDNVLRIRTLEQLTSAERTLQSLAALLGEISNIVIDDVVGASIKEAVVDIGDATTLAQRGELAGAAQTSQRALLAADAAFTAPSLLALLYFPDDQKYAVYIPLFLPVLFPVVMSTKNILRWLRGAKPVAKEKTE